MPRPDDPAVPALDPTHARAARLEARLAVYAQYAAVVAEQAAATAVGDPGRVETLAAERERVAEHFDELRAPLTVGTPTFRAALDDALAELAHQGAVDSALGVRLAALRDAVVRGAAWADPAGDPAGDPARAPRRMLPPAAPGSPTDGPPDDGGADPVDGVLGGALVAARAAGVGGALGGQFPGRAARDDYPAGWSGSAAADGAADGAPGAPHVDIRF
jgi:hypothetical protein